MLLSVIVPVYNAEKFLRDCLNSLLNQGLNEADYEIICINDGSGDNSLQIIEEYAENNENIVIINQKNAGVSAARNAGIKVARGKYITFCDSDDAVKADYFSKITTFMELHQVNVALHPFLNRTDENFVYTNNDATSSLDVRILPNSKFTTKSIFTLIIEKDIIDSNKLVFNEKMKYGEDTLFSALLSLEAYRLNCKIAYVRTPVYYYRSHSDSAMHTVNYEEHLNSMYTMALEYVKAKEKYKNDKRFEGGLNRKTGLSVTAVLYDNLRCKKYKPKEIFSLLEKDNLYPYEIPFWYLRKNNFKTYIINLLKCTQAIKPLYAIYYALFRNKK